MRRTVRPFFLAGALSLALLPSLPGPSRAGADVPPARGYEAVAEKLEAFIRREVLPHAPDAWIDKDKTAIGYEISFARYFYKPQPLRSLAEIRADILALEKETEGLMASILGANAQ